MNPPENCVKKRIDKRVKDRNSFHYLVHVCDVPKQEGGTRSQSGSRATLSSGMGSSKRRGVGAAGMLAQAPGPLCTHMQ